MAVTITGLKSHPGVVHIFSGTMTPPSSGIGGSLEYVADSALSIAPASAGDMYVGTGDFTVEWFQYEHEQEGVYSRAFSQGSWPAALFAVSVEPTGTAGEGSFFLWGGGSGEGNGQIAQVAISSYIDTWTHFAVVRSSGTLTIYQNGLSILSQPDSTDIGDATGTVPLILGNDIGDTTISQFYGFITNFRLMLGVAVYTENFTVPTSPLPSLEGTNVLLSMTDSGNALVDAGGHTVENVGETPVAWNSSNPF